MKITENDKVEIAMMYRQAADKKEQIKILSELYLLSRREVCRILSAAGHSDKHIIKHLDAQAEVSPNKGKSAWTSAEEDRLIALRREKRSYLECARALGRSQGAIVAKIYRMGI